MSWAVTVTAVGTGPSQDIAFIRPSAAGVAEPVGRSRLFDGQLGVFADSPVYWRDAIGTDQTISGPAIIAEDETSTVVTSTFHASIDANGSIILNAKV